MPYCGNECEAYIIEFSDINKFTTQINLKQSKIPSKFYQHFSKEYLLQREYVDSMKKEKKTRIRKSPM